MGENLREKVDAITIWQDTTQTTIRELQSNVTKLPDEVDICFIVCIKIHYLCLPKKKLGH